MRSKIGEDAGLGTVKVQESKLVQSRSIELLPVHFGIRGVNLEINSAKAAAPVSPMWLSPQSRWQRLGMERKSGVIEMIPLRQRCTDLWSVEKIFGSKQSMSLPDLGIGKC